MLSLVPIRGTRESVLIQFLLVVFGGFNMSETGICWHEFLRISLGVYLSIVKALLFTHFVPYTRNISVSLGSYFNRYVHGSYIR